MKITYSAPAKIILSGEHSVVYIKPAFVTAVDFHLTVTIEDGTMQVQTESVHTAVSYIDDVVKNYIQKKSIEATIRPFTYSLTSTIPEGRGMGSSAAFCVAFTAAILHFYTGRESDKQTISSLAYQCEKYFHGMPSGVDVSASCYGGLIFYRKEFEFLKTISALNFKIPRNFEEKLILIDTGRPVESTKEMVAHVGKRYNKHPKQMDKVLYEIEKVTRRMVISIVKEDFEMFKESIRENEVLLEDLGIVSEQTKNILAELAQFGVGKVTGAGGLSRSSGQLLFVVTKEQIFVELKKRGISWLPFKMDVKGVRLISLY